MGTYAAGDATKERIKDAARLLFYEQGVTSVSDAAICRAAEVQRGLVSYHFGGRGSLVAAIYQEFAELLRAVVRDHFAIDDPVLSYCVLEHLLLELLHRDEIMRRFYVEIIQYPEVSDEEVHVQHEQFSAILASRKDLGLSDRLKIAVAMSQGTFNETVRCIENGYLSSEIKEIIDIDLMMSMSLLGFDSQYAERVVEKTTALTNGCRLTVDSAMIPRVELCVD